LIGHSVGDMTKKRETPTPDEAVGEMLSWVAGKKVKDRPGSPTKNAIGELLSWITGKKRR
jgi:hypothetical protein